MKRTIEVVLAAALLVMVLPVLLLVLVGSAIALRDSPVFVQSRVGRYGVPFRVIKVRTLPRATPTYASKYELESCQIPTFCRAVRGLHLDELPQLLHVLAGQMGLVGPRPEMPQLEERMDPAFAELRTSVRPGCTGLWQVSDAQFGLIAEHPEFDEYYLSHQSLRLDLWILWRTAVQAVPFLDRPPVSFADLPPWAPVPIEVRIAEYA
jgi:lipopolysaccharide/colanic/teichoic acid biosynthesis glycosyltransferase